MSDSLSQDLVSVPAEDVAAVIPFRAHGDIRYYLDGVLVEPVATGGCMIIATEGHMLGAIFSPKAKADEPRILRISKALEDLLREDPPENENRTISVADAKGRLTVNHRGTEEFVQAGLPFIDGRFPDWRKVMPPVEQIKPGAPAALQARYLTTLWKTCRDKRAVGVHFSHDARNPDTGAAVVQFVQRPGLIVLIMAMKFDRPEWPQWMPHEKKEEAA